MKETQCKLLTFENTIQENPAPLHRSSPNFWRQQIPHYLFQPIRTKAYDRLIWEPLPKVTAVIAPPGYGKTVLLAQAFQEFEEAGQICIWVSFDYINTDSNNLLENLEDILGIKSDLNIISVRIDCVLKSIFSLAGKVVVFIDNVDLSTAVGTGELLDALALKSPPEVKFVFSVTTEIPWGSYRPLLELRPKVIGIRELEFGVQNIQQLFQETGIMTTTEVASQVQSKCEGWPAAVRLMQIITVEEPCVQYRDERFNYESMKLVEALFRKIIDQLSSDTISFLCQIGELDLFSVLMVNKILDRKDAGVYVSNFIKYNLMISPVGDGWFRFHGLFRNYLIYFSEKIADCNEKKYMLARASEWHEGAGNIRSAFDLSLRAGDYASVSRILDLISRSLVRNLGELPAFINLVQTVESAGGQLGAEAKFWYAWALIFCRHYDQARITLRSLKCLENKAISIEKKSNTILGKIELTSLILGLHMDDLEGLNELSVIWLNKYMDADGFERGAVAGIAGLALLADGKLTQARAVVRESLACVAVTDSIYGRNWATNIWAAIEIRSGNPKIGSEILGEFKPQIALENDHKTIIASVTALIYARTLFACGCLTEAIMLVEQNLLIASKCGILDFVWLGFEVLVPAILRGQSQMTLLDLKRIARNYSKRLEMQMDLLMIRLLINDGGRFHEALKLATELGIWTDSEIFVELNSNILDIEKSMLHLTAITLYTACGNFQAADELIGCELQRAKISGRHQSEIELYLAQAALYQKKGCWEVAVRTLGKAISLAVDQELLNPFYEQRNLISLFFDNAKIKDLGISTVEALKLVEGIQQIIGGVKERKIIISSVDALENLTRRERELIAMLDAGLDNAQIAQALSISLSTVKWHLFNMYAKLDVKNRTSALAKARSLNLL